MQLARSASVSGGSVCDVEIVNSGSLGEPFVLRCNDEREVSRWIAAINERIQWKMKELNALSRLEESSLSGALLPSSLTADIPVCPIKAGWLKKKGKHKYTGQQVRFGNIRF